MKNCAFQYATSREVIKDTTLITRDEANELWINTVPDFIKSMEAGDDPEMAIWIDMNSDTNYHKTAKHWQAEDMILKDGVLYEIVEAT